MSRVTSSYSEDGGVRSRVRRGDEKVQSPGSWRNESKGEALRRRDYCVEETTARDGGMDGRRTDSSSYYMDIDVVHVIGMIVQTRMG